MSNLKEISNTAVNKAVLSKTAQSPVSIYPMAMGVLGGFSAVLFNFNLLSVGLMAGGFALGMSGFAAKYIFGKEKYANQYMQEIRQQLIEKRRGILNGLEDNLNKVNRPDGIKQIRLFNDKYHNLLSILDKKLEPGELTHTRYLTIAEQVFLGGLDNLHNATLALESVSAIDIEHINDNITKTADSPITESLETRKQLFQTQTQRANQLLSQNEIALTQLDHVTTKLANIKTEQGHATMDIEDAMAELETLIKRADSYST